MKRQLSVLVTDEMKAFLIGSAVVENASEADVTRALLDRAIDQATADLSGHVVEQRIEVGMRELARLDAERAARQAAEAEGR